MKYPGQKIDRSSIENANSRAKDQINHVLNLAKKYTEDTFREQRLDKSECIVCYGGSKIGGASTTIRPCGLCGQQLSSGNTCIDAICIACAKENSLCRHCGADIELKNKRKPRPFESKPPVHKCVNLACQYPLHISKEYCFMCGHRQFIAKENEKIYTTCRAGKDGECNYQHCPQNNDGEPERSGRHCPLDTEGDGDYE